MAVPEGLAAQPSATRRQGSAAKRRGGSFRRSPARSSGNSRPRETEPPTRSMEAPSVAVEAARTPPPIDSTASACTSAHQPSSKPVGAEAVVCAACPSEHQEAVAELCKQYKVMKVFSREGLAWSAEQWEARVVMAVAGLVGERGAPSSRVVCIEGALHAADIAAAQQRVVRAARLELGDADFPITFAWLSFRDFVVRCGNFEDKATACPANGSLNPAARSPSRRRNHSRGRVGGGRPKSSCPQQATSQSGPAEAAFTMHSAGDARNVDVADQTKSERPPPPPVPKDYLPQSCDVCPRAAVEPLEDSEQDSPQKAADKEHRPSDAQLGAETCLRGTESMRHEVTGSSGGGLAAQDWPSLVQALRAPSCGAARLRKPSAAGKRASAAASKSPSRKAIQGLRSRRDPLSIVWTCQECKAIFHAQGDLLEHQEAEFHFSPTLDDDGRTFVRKRDISGDLPASPADTSKDGVNLDEDRRVPCEVFNMAIND